MADEVEFDDVQRAAQRIQGIAHRTPVLTSRTFDELAGASVFFKCENFQRGGAFKIRGASNFIRSMSPADLQRGVVAFSSGNHAQAVAIAAASAGTHATIAMPIDAPKTKVAATRGYGAKIVFYDRVKEDRETVGRQIAEEQGATLVPPYDHPWILAGQGTAALELLDEVPDLDAILVPIGGGGLIAGSSISAKAMRPGIRVFGVEPEDGNDTYLSVQAGKRVEIPPPQTIADGLRAAKPGTLTFPIVQKNVEQIVLVNDTEILDAVRFLMSRMKIVVEPSGAAPAAALLSHKLPNGLKRIGAILSGGNIDWELLATLAQGQK